MLSYGGGGRTKARPSLTPVATSDIPRLRRNSVRSPASNNSAPSLRSQGHERHPRHLVARYGQQTDEAPEREFSRVTARLAHRVIGEPAELTHDRAPPVPFDSIEPTVATAQVQRRTGVDDRFGKSLLPCMKIGHGIVTILVLLARTYPVEIATVQLHVLIVDDEVRVFGRLPDRLQVSVPTSLVAQPDPVHVVQQQLAFVSARGRRHQCKRDPASLEIGRSEGRLEIGEGDVGGCNDRLDRREWSLGDKARVQLDQRLVGHPDHGQIAADPHFRVEHALGGGDGSCTILARLDRVHDNGRMHDLPQDRTVAFPQGIEERLDGGEDRVAVGAGGHVGGPGGWRGLRERWALGITGGGAATRKGQPREGSDSGESVHEFRSSLRVIER